MVLFFLKRFNHFTEVFFLSKLSKTSLLSKTSFPRVSKLFQLCNAKYYLSNGVATLYKRFSFSKGN